MGIRTTIAVSLLFVTATAHAATNSWKTGSTFWDISATAWSAGFPSITNEFTLVTNVTSKLVTIDNFTVSGDPTTLTISNLVVGGPVGTTNTLFLSNMQTNTPLRMVNSFAITNNGVVQITNSFLEVDGLSGGISQIDGTLKIFPRAKIVLNNTTINAGATLQFALGNNYNPVVVSNLTLGGTLNVTDGGGLTNITYTLFNYLGTLTYNGLSVASVPSNFTASVSTSTAGQVNLVVAGIAPTAEFTASPTSGTEPLVVTFTDASLGSFPRILTWNFGDSPPTNTAGGVSFPHTYAAGTYTVTLTASNNFGVSTLVSNNLIVVASGLTPFQQWQLQYFNCTNCPQAQANADPLGKGISNTNQFLLGLNPTNSSSVFRITSNVRNTTDVVIAWATAGVRTNVVQATAGTADGSFNTNNFVTISPPIVINITGDTVTNYTDFGGATNTPSRFYRVRLVP
jgi:PKD repeat protein